MTSFETLADALDHAATTDGEIGFIDGANDERRLAFRLLARAALRILAVLQSRGANAGEPLILFVADNLRFVQFFWAAIYGGLVPVPVAAGASDAHLQKLVNVWRHMGEPRVVADAKHVERVRAYLERIEGSGAAERFIGCAMSDEPPAVEGSARRASPAAGDTAFIQFSSGSTGQPKGVVLTHANVLANIRGITQGSAFAGSEVAVSWMPLTHDMGLIGFHLTLVFHAFNHYLMATDLFARRPMLWLEKAAEKRATLLCSPNFGYRHTLRAISAKGLPEDLDLSAVRRIYNGAEPIAPALAREFLDTLAPTGLAASSMFAVYGLAEASLAATFPPAGSGLATLSVARGELGVGDAMRLAEGDAALELVNLGRPVAGADVRIADGNGQPLADDIVGRVWIRGDNVTGGYHDNPEANAGALMGDGWLDTGDLGFVHAGDLFITGRAKEIIFINGQNHYPQDLEAIAQAAQGADLNKIAAVGVRPPGAEADELVLFVIFRGRLPDFVPIAREVASLINQHAGLAVTRVLPIKQMPKTTSGKLKRAQLAADVAAGEFAEVSAELAGLMREKQAEVAAATGSVADDLKRICDDVSPDKNIGPSDDLFEIGLSSLELAQIHEGIEARWPDRLEVTDLFDYPTINDLAAYLENEPG